MTSREVRDLAPEIQVLWNKFHDRVRRDITLQRMDISILLSCTKREGKHKDLIYRTPSEAFEIVMLRDGRPETMLVNIIEHAASVGLKYNGHSFTKQD